MTTLYSLFTNTENQTLNLLRLIFSRKWILSTLLAVAAAGVMVRLGIWQLDRLEQRRALNARVQAQLDAPALDLNMEAAGNGETFLSAELEGMEYRSVRVEGVYDFSNEVVLRNQTWQNLLGVHLLTPLQVSGSDQVVLVDRGFVSMDDFNAGKLAEFEEAGQVQVSGYIRLSRDRADMGRATDPAHVPGERLDSFYIANIGRIEQQMPYELLPVYIVQTPSEGYNGALGREPLSLVLNEGSHLGYAIQWFAFAAILLGGYPFFVKKSTERDARQAPAQNLG